MLDSEQNAHLRVSAEAWAIRRRAYLPAVIYFGLELRLFLKGKMFVCMYVLENWTFYMKTF